MIAGMVSVTVDNRAIAFKSSIVGTELRITAGQTIALQEGQILAIEIRLQRKAQGTPA
jgi:hypothetical protein